MTARSLGAVAAAFAATSMTARGRGRKHRDHGTPSLGGAHPHSR